MNFFKKILKQFKKFKKSDNVDKVELLPESKNEDIAVEKQDFYKNLRNSIHIPLKEIVQNEKLLNEVSEGNIKYKEFLIFCYKHGIETLQSCIGHEERTFSAGYIFFENLPESVVRSIVKAIPNYSFIKTDFEKKLTGSNTSYIYDRKYEVKYLERLGVLTNVDISDIFKQVNLLSPETETELQLSHFNGVNTTIRFATNNIENCLDVIIRLIKNSKVSYAETERSIATIEFSEDIMKEIAILHKPHRQGIQEDNRINYTSENSYSRNPDTKRMVDEYLISKNNVRNR